MLQGSRRHYTSEPVSIPKACSLQVRETGRIGKSREQRVASVSYTHLDVYKRQAELYTGLVEVGVGLLPGAGGCKEMLLRAVDSVAASRGKASGQALAGSVEMMEAIKKAFEAIATAKVATSAQEARGLGFLSDSDRITMNRERVLSDAKARALELARAGYEPPVPRTDIPAPGESLLAALKMGVHLMRQGDFITDYEVKLGGKIAEVLCGGNVTPGTPVSEQYILCLLYTSRCV